jgi:hypothetical protein
MRDPNVSCRRFLLIASILVSGVVACGQSGPKYDVATETKLKGVIADLKLPDKGNSKEIAHLTVKSGTETLDLYLCPRSFMDDMGVSFAKGDEIAVTGSKVKEGDSDMVLTREIVKGTDTLVLRDEKGNPVWNWKK